MAARDWSDPDVEVKATAFTTKAHRDVYPAIDPSHPELTHAGKIVVITGASRGLGRLGFAASFARANAAAIVLIGRSVSNLADTEKLVKEINRDIKVLSIPLDVTDEVGVEKAFQSIVAQFGVPNVPHQQCGNNRLAGEDCGVEVRYVVADSGWSSSPAHLLSLTGFALDAGETTANDEPAYKTSQETNIKGTFLVTRAFLKHTGSDPSSPTTIINLTSTSAQATPPGQSSYSAASLALNKFTSFLNFEYPAITSVSLDPGVVPTDMAYSVPYLALIMGDTPELSGGTAVWLSTGDKSYLSGRYVAVNWDVEELEQKKDEVKSGNLLTFGSGGPNVIVDGTRK